MAGEFNTIFTYTGNQDNSIFYNLISPCKNSMECHTTMLELFMNALKLSSITYRKGVFPNPSPVKAIPNQVTLNAILNYIPEDIKDPYWQVMYEHWNFKQNNQAIGNNATYVETFKDATNGAKVPQDLQDAVNLVRSVYYALEYNNLIREYEVKGWANNPPKLIDNPTPQNHNLTPAVVKDCLVTLNDWITDNNPKLIALSTLKGLKPAPAILDKVFGDTPIANIDIVAFCLELLNQIQASNVPKVIGQKGPVRLFLEMIEQTLSQGGIWISNTKLKKLTEQFRAKTVANYWRKNIPAAFDLIGQLFQIGLTLSNHTELASVKKSIETIFLNLYKSSIPKDYLLNQLIDTCKDLEQTVSPDNEVLVAWQLEIDEAIPLTIHYSDIDALLEVVTEQLSLIPIESKTGGFPVRLFPFSIFDNIHIKTDVVRFPIGKTSKNSDVVIVTADASETAHHTEYYRPVVGSFTKKYTSHQGEKHHLTFLKFFNIENIKDGSFYFTDPTNTSLVQTNGFLNPPNPVFFDFKAVTINGSDKTTSVVGDLIIGTEYKTKTGTGFSKKNFIEALKVLTKWKEISGRRNYDVIYETVLGQNLAINPHLIWYMSSGNLDRTDRIDDSLCVIDWQAPQKIIEQYSRLPEILNLPKNRWVRPELSSLSILGGDIRWYMNYIGVDDDDGYNDYVLVNTPRPKLPAGIAEVLGKDASTSTSLSDEAEKILHIFNFAYYRKIKSKKVIKWLPAKNKPDSDASGTSFGADDPDVIGIDPPVSFRLDRNLGFFKKYTTPNGPAGTYLKNKGNPLYRARGKRLAAGTVMANIRDSIGVTPLPGTASSLSATTFGNWVLSKSEKSLSEWQLLKMNKRGNLPTDQEWCHLLGHGDGGDERLGNFVAGSFHCNTEQLAMESKERRQVTQRSKGAYELRSTAYLFNDDETLLSENYLRNDRAYKKMVKVYNALNKAPGKPMRTNGAGKVSPFVALMRYKMYKKKELEMSDSDTNTQSIKCFDHIFEGQSEFIDQHQFSILKHVAWFALEGVDAFEKWYKEQVEALEEGVVDMNINKI